MSKLTKDSWNANLYDESHSFVSKFGESLIELLAPVKGENILDAGCGTGDLTNAISLLDCNVIGVDYSQNMIKHAQAKYPRLQFYERNIQKLGYVNQFDAVFSNAVLHWVKQPKEALVSIFEALKPGGRFVAEFGGLGNVQLITNELQKQFVNKGKTYESPWFFPSIGEYSTLMEETGFVVTFAIHYSRPTSLNGERGLRDWLDMFGSSLFTNLSLKQKQEIIEKVEEELRPHLFSEHHWMADYKRIRVMGYKL